MATFKKFFDIDGFTEQLGKSVAPVYLIYGKDAYLRELALKRIKDKVLSAPELNLNVFDGEYCRQHPDELVSALMQYPFMSEKRVVLVREYNPTLTDLKNKGISGYFNNPPDSSVLVIVNRAASRQLSGLPNITEVPCDEAGQDSIVRYIKASLKNAGLSVSDADARVIIGYCKSEMTRISGEVKKLAAYCYGAGEVKRADIDALVNKDSDYRIYEFTDMVVRKNNDRAYEIMNELLADDADYQRLFTSLYYHFRRLFFSLISDGNAAALSEFLDVKEFAVTKYREQAAAFGPKRLKEIMDMFVRLDTGYKTGRISILQAVTLCMGKIMQ